MCDMNIAICDDEEIFLNNVYQSLLKLQEHSVKCYLSPTALLEDLRGGKRYDVIFLDVVMEPTDGIETAREIRRTNRRVILIFLTVALEYAPAGYEVDAFRYLLKPVAETNLFRVLADVRNALETSSDTILLETPECQLLLHTEDLYYLEADDKESILCYVGDLIRVRKCLRELERKLSPTRFFRIHRKYLVNLAHIREFDEKKLTLDCGRTLPLSRRKSAGFRNALQQYVEGA